MMEKALYNILSNTTGVTDLVSTRIYPDAIPQDATIPAVTYSRGGTDPDDTKDGTSLLDTVSFAVASHDDDMLGALNLSDAVRAALDRKAAGTYGGTVIQSIKFDNQTTDFNEDRDNRWVIVQTFSMRVDRS